VFTAYGDRFPYYWALMMTQINLLIPIYGGLAVFLWPSMVRGPSQTTQRAVASRSDTAPLDGSRHREGIFSSKDGAQVVAAIN